MMRLVKLGGASYKDAWIVLPGNYRNNAPVAAVLTRNVVVIGGRQYISLPNLLRAGERVTFIVPLGQGFVAYAEDIARLIFNAGAEYRIGRTRWVQPVPVPTPALSIDDLVRRAVRRAVAKQV